MLLTLLNKTDSFLNLISYELLKYCRLELLKIEGQSHGARRHQLHLQMADWIGYNLVKTRLIRLKWLLYRERNDYYTDTFDLLFHVKDSETVICLTWNNSTEFANLNVNIIIALNDCQYRRNVTDQWPKVFDARDCLTEERQTNHRPQSSFCRILIQLSQVALQRNPTPS